MCSLTKEAIETHLEEETGSGAVLNDVFSVKLKWMRLSELVTPCGPCALSCLKSLRALDLSYNCLKSLQGVETVPTLRKLCAVGNNLRVLPDLGKLRALEYLDLRDNLLTLDALKAAQVPRLPKLTYLSLEGNCLTGLSKGILPPSITSLNVGDNRLHTLEGLASLPRLRQLELSNAGVRLLPNFLSLQNLEELVVSRNDLGEAGLGLTKCPNMHTLHADGNKFKDVHGLPFCPHLAELNLANNALETLEGLHSLAPSVDCLDVSGNLFRSPVELAIVVSECSLLGDLSVERIEGWSGQEEAELWAELAVRCPQLQYFNGCCRGKATEERRFGTLTTAVPPTARQAAAAVSLCRAALDECRKQVTEILQASHAAVASAGLEAGAVASHKWLQRQEADQRSVLKARMETALILSREHENSWHPMDTMSHNRDNNSGPCQHPALTLTPRTQSRRPEHPAHPAHPAHPQPRKPALPSAAHQRERASQGYSSKRCNLNQRRRVVLRGSAKHD